VRRRRTQGIAGPGRRHRGRAGHWARHLPGESLPGVALLLQRRPPVGRHRHPGGLGRVQRHPAVPFGVEVQPVRAPHPAVAQHLHPPQVDQHAVPGFGDRAQVHVVDGDLAAQHPDDRERAGVEPGEQQHPAAGPAQAGHGGVERLGQQVRVRARAQDVVAARRDADQVRPELDRPRHLLRRDLAQQLAANSQVGVAQTGLFRGQQIGEPVRPAAVSAAGCAIVQALGEAVAQGNKRTGVLRGCTSVHIFMMPAWWGCSRMGRLVA
jgi:hypothetical protein